LQVSMIARQGRKFSYCERIQHDLSGERCVDDEIAVVGHHGAGFCLRHAQGGVWGTENMVQILQNFGVCERHDLDWDTGCELRAVCMSFVACRKARTFFPR